MSHSRDQSPKENRTSSISKSCHEDETTNNAYFFRSLLGNLRKVEQGGQLRYYGYDSLSRLIRVRAVEQTVNSSLSWTDPVTNYNGWTTALSYNANGTLHDRTDARGVVTTYTYDTLNRNTIVAYTNDPSGTPTITRRYDGWGVTDNGSAMNYNIPNSRGRAWRVETAGSTGTRITVDGYDPMGRPTQQEQ